MPKFRLKQFLSLQLILNALATKAHSHLMKIDLYDVPCCDEAKCFHEIFSLGVSDNIRALPGGSNENIHILIRL